MQALALRDTPLAQGLRDLLRGLEQRLQPSKKIRVLIPNDLVVDVHTGDTVPTALHFDTNYNSSFALMHEDYQVDAVPTDFNEGHFELFVLSPVDLALSKVARFLDNDKEDIASLAREGLVSAQALNERGEQALAYCVGGREAAANLRDAVAIVERNQPQPRRPAGEVIKG